MATKCDSLTPRVSAVRIQLIACDLIPFLCTDSDYIWHGTSYLMILKLLPKFEAPFLFSD